MARASLIVDRTPGVPLDDRNRPIIEVARHPHDLERHALRIRSAQTPEEAYGALVDLFIATAPMHAKLRRLALEEHGALLDEAPRAALAAAVEDGLRPASPIPACPESLFTAGVTSGHPLVLERSPDDVEPDLVAPETVAPETAAPETVAPETVAPMLQPEREPEGSDDRLRTIVGLLLAGALLVALRRWLSGRTPDRR